MSDCRTLKRNNWANRCFSQVWAWGPESGVGRGRCWLGGWAGCRLGVGSMELAQVEAAQPSSVSLQPRQPPPPALHLPPSVSHPASGRTFLRSVILTTKNPQQSEQKEPVTVGSRARASLHTASATGGARMGFGSRDPGSSRHSLAAHRTLARLPLLIHHEQSIPPSVAALEAALSIGCVNGRESQSTGASTARRDSAFPGRQR